jgi:3-phosphoshikimate 1-carboxyvinyltransferase
MEISTATKLKGEINIPGDKSISHRAAIIGAISRQNIVIKGFLFSKDCINTVDIIKKLGIKVEKIDDSLIVYGKDIKYLREPDDILYTGNSGTTIRLMSGILCATNFISVLSGDRSINNRPMDRIIEPLREMGASIYGRDKNRKAPIIIFGTSKLRSRCFNIITPSAQVKSCILLAALFAKGKTEIIQPAVSRDHTERMLEYFDANIKYDGKYTKIIPGKALKGKDIFVPGDISSAAYFIVATLILKDSCITIKNAGINPTRSYYIEILKKMGANIEIENKRMINNEPVGDIKVSSSNLHSVKIEKKFIPNIIDEIPIICVAAAFAEGKTVITGAGELRFKESDRISSVFTQFKKLGVKIKEKKDGLIIHGNNNLTIGEDNVNSMGDHRIAMSLAVLGLRSKGVIKISDSECIETSFPGFKYEFRKLFH